ncbi:MAG: hypothetical protein AB1568_15370 [Thermodesulfobacteriota bacterium]
MENYRQTQRDRRRFRRMPAREGCFVIFDNSSSLVGRIVNICSGGLCCLINGRLPSRQVRSLSLVVYQTARQAFSLLDLPMEALEEKRHFPMIQQGNLTSIRLTFGALSSTQRSQLARFFL